METEQEMTPINHPGFGRPERAREGVRGRDGRGKVREGRETWRGTEREGRARGERRRRER